MKKFTPQTQKQCLRKCRAMIKDNQKALVNECTRLILSGALPFDKYGNTFELPKVVMATALMNQAFQYKPNSAALKKIHNKLVVF